MLYTGGVLMLGHVLPEAASFHISLMNLLNPKSIFFAWMSQRVLVNRALFQALESRRPKPPLSLGRVTSLQATKGLLLTMHFPLQRKFLQSWTILDLTPVGIGRMEGQKHSTPWSTDLISFVLSAYDRVAPAQALMLSEILSIKGLY